MIHENIMQRSKEVAQKVLDLSVNLRVAGAKVDYFDRDDYLQSLVGEEGHVTFNPEVTADILEPFRALIEDDTQKLRNDYRDVPYYSSQADIARFRLYLADSLAENLTAGHILKNEVPKRITTFVEESCVSSFNSKEVVKVAKGYKSPKLSKILVKLFGEQSETVKWFTTKCPKKLSKGVLDDWTVTLSVLPHHIAGMSYYAALNHGGKRWREGYEGTSCMDTKRNGIGTGVFQLVPSLRDVTMAVAYLSYSKDSDIWNPIYQARCLVRVVHVHGTPHLIVCRPYFISNESTHILVEGLKNKFDNVHFVRDMREYKGDNKVSFELEFPSDIAYEVDDQKITCDHCDGVGNEGEDEWGDSITCPECRGEGYWYVDGHFLPYIDDSDFIRVNRQTIKFKLPVDYFKTKGIDIEKPKKVEHKEEAVLSGLFDDEIVIEYVDFRILEQRAVANGVAD